MLDARCTHRSAAQRPCLDPPILHRAGSARPPAIWPAHEPESCRHRCCSIATLATRLSRVRVAECLAGCRRRAVNRHSSGTHIVSSFHTLFRQDVLVVEARALPVLLVLLVVFSAVSLKIDLVPRLGPNILSLQVCICREAWHRATERNYACWVFVCAQLDELDMFLPACKQRPVAVALPHLEYALLLSCRRAGKDHTQPRPCRGAMSASTKQDSDKHRSRAPGPTTGIHQAVNDTLMDARGRSIKHSEFSYGPHREREELNTHNVKGS